MRTITPGAYRGYPCEDYFASSLRTTGWQSDDGYPYVVPEAQLAENPSRTFLDIGGPGVDGIRWGYRAGQTGIWAYYPLDDNFVLLAANVLDLQEGYASGRISV